MGIENTVGSSANGSEAQSDALREHVASYVAEKSYEEGVQSLEAAFRAALNERVRQLEADGLSKDEAIARANAEEDEAYERNKRARDNG